MYQRFAVELMKAVIRRGFYLLSVGTLMGGTSFYLQKSRQALHGGGLISITSINKQLFHPAKKSTPVRR
jgi:hypothetical protein